MNPIAGLPPMMSNGQHLHHARDFAVNDVEVKNLEPDATNIGRMDDARTERHFADQRQGHLEFRVVATPKARLFVLVPSNLLRVFVRGFRVKPIAHLRIA